MHSKWFVILASLLIAVFIGFFIGRSIGGKRPKIETRVQVDTLVIRDTLRVLQPTEITKYVIKKEVVPVSDTISIHDTLYMIMDRESRTYSGEDYKAVVTGISPALEYIEVYPTTKIITKDNYITSRKNWGFSIGTGPGVIYSPFKKEIDAGVGVWCGLTYTF